MEYCADAETLRQTGDLSAAGGELCGESELSPAPTGSPGKPLQGGGVAREGANYFAEVFTALLCAARPIRM